MARCPANHPGISHSQAHTGYQAQNKTPSAFIFSKAGQEKRRLCQPVHHHHTSKLALGNFLIFRNHSAILLSSAFFADFACVQTTDASTFWKAAPAGYCRVPPLPGWRLFPQMALNMKPQNFLVPPDVSAPEAIQT